MYGRLLCMDVCYDSSYFRDTLHDQIGSEHVPVHVNEWVSSRFWCDSCCMTKYDQVSSGWVIDLSLKVRVSLFLFKLNLKFLLRQMKGVELCPYMENGCLYGLIMGRHNAAAF